MTRTVSILIASILALMLLGACTQAQADAPVRLTESDAGKTVQLKSEQTLEVVLPGNPTTGYSWEVETIDNAVLKQSGEPEFQADSKAMGSGGMITMRFIAGSSGTSDVKLIYHRSFEKGVAPLKTFEFSVKVE